MFSIFNIFKNKKNNQAPAKGHYVVIKPKAYEAAKVNRLTWSWNTYNYTADQIIYKFLKVLVARSCNEYMNDPHAVKFLSLLENNVIGDKGISLQAQAKDQNGELDQKANEAHEKAWKEWQKAKYCDVKQQQNFIGLCKLAIKTCAREGECLIRIVKGRNAGAWGFALQLIDPRRLDIDKNDSIIINTDFGEKTLSVSDVCINYIDNYIFMGEIVYNELFNNEETSNFIYNSYLIDFISNNQDDIGVAIDYLSNLDVVSSVSSTTSTRQMYDSIIDNLSMIVILIVILSGALAAIVIYNLTDININERIREIATLRVLGYRRREVLMYILREIFVMATIGIAIGLGIGVFLHWFIVINIESVGILFSLTISWQSYIYAILIAWVFVIAVTMCFYPRIRKINMAESLKSVD